MILYYYYFSDTLGVKVERGVKFYGNPFCFLYETESAAFKKQKLGERESIEENIMTLRYGPNPCKSRCERNNKRM